MYHVSGRDGSANGITRITMKQYNLYNLIAGWAVFLISAVVYLMTIEPTASFWDCGEFILTATNIQVGHPPEHLCS